MVFFICIMMGQWGLEETVEDFEKLNLFTKSVRKGACIKQIQELGVYIGLIQRPKALVEKYQPAS